MYTMHNAAMHDAQNLIDKDGLGLTRWHPLSCLLLKKMLDFGQACRLLS